MFSAYGNVKATKVISDRAGVSKGYGFVTFETEEEAKRLMQDVSSKCCCYCYLLRRGNIFFLKYVVVTVTKFL
jgi:hypothetical protein